MRRVFFFLFLTITAVILLGGAGFLIVRNAGRGALQVTATPRSSVYLNGEIIGQTPLCKCDFSDMIPTGEYTIRLVPQSSSFVPFEQKISIERSILSVVDRTFKQGAASEGSIISLTQQQDAKSIELITISFPQGASVAVDNVVSGVTPLQLKNLTESDHDVNISKEGYKDKLIRIRTKSGYKLTIEAFLGIDENKKPAASSSADMPIASASATPTPVASVLILQTPTGFLRVREEKSLSSKEIGRVLPEETYPLLAEDERWYQIVLKDGAKGWISTQYAKKQ